MSAQDADGWQGREHVGWLFSDGDSALQELLRTHLILPNILGDFLTEHLDEIAGGRMFALEKANISVRPIVIGSLWRRCAALLGVAEVRSNVATFSMSQYTNFIGCAVVRRIAPKQPRIIRVGPNTGGLFTIIFHAGSLSDSTLTFRGFIWEAPNFFLPTLGPDLAANQMGPLDAHKSLNF